jgi:hypothetical protein
MIVTSGAPAKGKRRNLDKISNVENNFSVPEGLLLVF